MVIRLSRKVCVPDLRTLDAPQYQQTGRLRVRNTALSRYPIQNSASVKVIKNPAAKK